jgi:CheY-like chemotaxis protein
LVVDDTEDNRYLIKAYLRKHDCEIIEAADGEQAVEIVRQNELDMIFMDVQMPVLDGYAAMQKIRDFEREQHRKPSLIVALSADAQNENIALSAAAGCNDYLTKPIKKATLYGIIEHYFV